MADNRFENVKYVCWLKVCTAIFFAKEGLEKMTDSLAKQFHEHLQNKLKTGKYPCHLCSKEELEKQWRTNKLQCKMNVCDIWLNEIRTFLPNSKTSIEFGNSDISLIPTDVWECIKLFMPHGCSTVTEAREADMSAILTLFIKNSFFLGSIGGNPIPLEKVKDMRNEIMHSGTMEVEEIVMQNSFETIINLLQCHDNLKKEQNCISAIAQIKQLESSVLEVSLQKYERQSLIERVDEMEKKVDQTSNKYNGLKKDIQDQNKVQTSTQSDVACIKARYRELHKETQDVKTEVELMRNSLSKFIEEYDIKGVDLTHLIKAASVIETLEMNMQDMKYAINNLYRRLEGVEQVIDEHEVKFYSYEKRLNKLENKEKYEAQGNVDTFGLGSSIKKQKTMETDEKELKSCLFDLYNEHCRHIPFYPLRPNLKRELEYIYVKQKIIEKDPRGQKQVLGHGSDMSDSTLLQEDKRIKSLNDIFYKNGEICKNIYVTGDAGVGKSTFCAYIVNKWLQAHLDMETNSSDVDLMTMKRFNFLFYIELRGIKLGTKYDIYAQLIEKQWDLDISIKEYLTDESCLILADALDECSSGIPVQGVRNKSTILITSRPWKLESLRDDIEGKTIDRQLEIVSLDEGSAEILADSILPILAEESISKPVSGKSSKAFIKDMKDNKLELFLRIPMLLLQMLCLWHDNRSIGNTNTSIYKNLTHYQIMVYVKKIEKEEKRIISSSRYRPLLCNIDGCICGEFNELLLKVGKLAIKTLISDARENQLVFDHGIGNMHGLNTQDIETCLNIGFLSQHKVFGKMTQPKKYICFLHKNNQEFFASIYLAYKESVTSIRSTVYADNLDKMLELEKVLMFVSNLNPCLGKEMAELLLEKAWSDHRVLEYRHTAGWSRYNRLVINIQDAILAAKNECLSQQSFRLNDIRVDNQNLSRVVSCISANYRVTSIYMQGENNRLPVDSIMSLITDDSIFLKVDLCSCEVGQISEGKLLPKSLCALYLSRVRMPHNGLIRLCEQFNETNNLKQVEVELLECEEHGVLVFGICAALRIDLHRHEDLEMLRICHVDMSECLLSATMKNLRLIHLECVTTTTDVIEKFYGSLPVNNIEVRFEEVTIRPDGDSAPSVVLDEIRQSCSVGEDSVEERDDGAVNVKYIIFYK